jgi:hypothetical protein
LGIFTGGTPGGDPFEGQDLIEEIQRAVDLDVPRLRSAEGENIIAGRAEHGQAGTRVVAEGLGLLKEVGNGSYLG